MKRVTFRVSLKGRGAETDEGPFVAVWPAGSHWRMSDRLPDPFFKSLQVFFRDCWSSGRVCVLVFELACFMRDWVYVCGEGERRLGRGNSFFRTLVLWRKSLLQTIKKCCSDSFDSCWWDSVGCCWVKVTSKVVVPVVVVLVMAMAATAVVAATTKQQ